MKKIEHINVHITQPTGKKHVLIVLHMKKRILINAENGSEFPENAARNENKNVRETSNETNNYAVYALRG